MKKRIMAVAAVVVMLTGVCAVVMNTPVKQVKEIKSVARVFLSFSEVDKDVKATIKAKQKENKKIQQEKEEQAKLEAERIAQEEAERIAQEEAERIAQEEAEQVEQQASQEFQQVSSDNEAVTYSQGESGVLTRSGGVNYYNGNKETWYSQRVLPGGGLDIPGRYVAEDGTIRDKDGYIVVALPSGNKGEIVETSLGTGKCYDMNAGGDSVDIYTDW